MKDQYNITDRELRELLQSLVMEHDNVLTENMINMEATLAFTSMPAHMPAIDGGQEMIRKLHTHFGYKAMMKWLFIVITGMMGISAFWIFKSTDQQSVIAKKAMIPAEQILKEGALPAQKEPATEGAHHEVTTPAESDPVIGEAIPVQPAEAEADPVPPADLNVPQAPLAHADNKTSGGTEGSFVVDTFFDGIHRIEIKTAVTDLNLTRAQGDRLSINGHFSIKTTGIVPEQRYKISYERNNDVLTVILEKTLNSGNWMIGTMEVDAVLNCSLPSGTDVVVKSGSGRITASGMNGKLCTLKTSYGDIKAEDLDVDAKISSSSGNVSVMRVKGKLDCETTYGDQELGDITGDVNSGCSSGNIKMSRVTGNISVHSTYGDIHLRQIKGDADLLSTSGNIDLEDVSGRLIGIKSTYGNTKIRQATGMIRISARSGDIAIAKTNGSIEIESANGNQTLSENTGSLTTSSSSGNIRISGLKGNMGISSIHGDVSATDCEGDVSITVQSGNISGKNLLLVSAMKLSTVSGSINMKLANKPDDLSFDLQSVSGDIRVAGMNTKDSRNINITKGRIVVKAFSSNGDQQYE